MAFKKIRNMKVYEQSGYHYKSTPTIMLKGQWGFWYNRTKPRNLRIIKGLHG